MLSLLPPLPEPWSADRPPTFIHAVMYEYDFNEGSIPTDELNGKEPERTRDGEWEDGVWWRRKVGCCHPHTESSFPLSNSDSLAIARMTMRSLHDRRSLVSNTEPNTWRVMLSDTTSRNNKTQSTGDYLKPLKKDSEDLTTFLQHFGLMANIWMADTFMFTPSSLVLSGWGIGIGIVGTIVAVLRLLLIPFSMMTRGKEKVQ